MIDESKTKRRQALSDAQKEHDAHLAAKLKFVHIIL